MFVLALKSFIDSGLVVQIIRLVQFSYLTILAYSSNYF